MRINRFFCGAMMFIMASFAFDAIAGEVRTSGMVASPADSSAMVPLGGNAWRTDKDTIGGNISNKGIVNWSKKSAGFVAYARFAKKGTFKLWLTLDVPDGETTLSVSALKNTRQLIVRGNTVQDHFVGEWTVRDTGYIAFTIKAISKTGDVCANIA